MLLLLTKFQWTEILFRALSKPRYNPLDAVGQERVIVAHAMSMKVFQGVNWSVTHSDEKHLLSTRGIDNSLR